MSIEDELKHGKITIMNYAMIERCPFRIFTPKHYREDGSCRCNEYEHGVMEEWGTCGVQTPRVSPDDDSVKAVAAHALHDVHLL